MEELSRPVDATGAEVRVGDILVAAHCDSISGAALKIYKVIEFLPPIEDYSRRDKEQAERVRAEPLWASKPYLKAKKPVILKATDNMRIWPGDLTIPKE